MKFTTTDSAPGSEYPFIGEHVRKDSRSFLVLFKGAGEGVVIDPRYSGYEVGFHCRIWDMEFFKRFTGVLSLSND